MALLLDPESQIQAVTHSSSQHHEKDTPGATTVEPLTSTDIQQTKYEEFHGAFNEDDYFDIPPDGGYGWFCTAYIALMNFATWGINCAYGVFLSYYLENNVFPNATPTDFGLIGGLVVFLTLGVIPYSAVLLIQFGYRITLTLGILIQLAGYLGASFSTTIAQLYVTQGVLIGISYGIIFGANSIVLPSWFLKKRALANGLSHIGVGLGGAVFSPAIDKLLRETGDHKWPYRMLGIVSFVICGTTMFLVKVRIPANSTIHNEDDPPSIKKVFRHIFDYRVWKSWPLQLATLWACLIATGYYICLFSISNYATTLGFSQQQAMIVTVVLNLSQAIGRPSMGIFSEMFGRVNFTMFATFYSMLLIFVFWINLQNYASLIIFALMFGLLFGIGSVNVVPLVVDVVGLNSFAAGLGWANTFTGIMSLIAEVIALNLRDYTLTKHTPYFYCQIFVGCMYFCALVALIPYRQWKVKRMLHQLKDSKSATDENRRILNELHDDKTIRGYLKRAFMATKV